MTIRTGNWYRCRETFGSIRFGRYYDIEYVCQDHITIGGESLSWETFLEIFEEPKSNR